MTTVIPDENGISDFDSDGSHNIISYYKNGVKFHHLKAGKKCKITGTNITIEYFPTDEERVTRFKDLGIETSDDVERRLPERFRTREVPTG